MIIWVPDEIGGYCPLSRYSGGGIGWGSFLVYEIQGACKFPEPNLLWNTRDSAVRAPRYLDASFCNHL